MLTSTVSYTEITWTVITFAGFLIVLYAYKLANDNRAYMQATIAERMRTDPTFDPTSFDPDLAVADSHVRGKTERLVTMLVFVLIGLTAMTQESRGGANVTSYVAAVSFIGVALMMVVTSVTELREDLRIIEKIKRRTQR